MTSSRFLQTWICRWWVVAGLALSLLVTTGCRTSTITSEPPGARIRVDDQDVGETPLTCKIWQGWFLFRGEYRVEAEKPGYQAAVRRFYEGPSGNVRSAVPETIHFILQPE
jgi:hypothetical protein